MSICEGDPKFSAYKLIHMIEDEINKERLDLTELSTLSGKFALDLDFSKLEANRDLACVGKMVANQLRSAIDSGKMDFYDVVDFLDDHFNTPPEQKYRNMVKKAKIRQTLNHQMNGAAMAMRIEGVDFLAPENKEPIEKIFSDVERKCLQELGILDEEGNVIPGQELFI